MEKLEQLNCIGQILNLLDIRKTTLYRKMEMEKFPKPKGIYGKTKLYSLKEVRDFLKPPRRKMYTVQEAAEELDMSYVTLNQYRRAKQVPEPSPSDHRMPRFKYYTHQQIVEMRKYFKKAGFYDSVVVKAQQERRKREKKRPH